MQPFAGKWKSLRKVSAINCDYADGYFLPAHFHATEVGLVAKYFIDCGGVSSKGIVANFHLWDAGYYDHPPGP